MKTISNRQLKKLLNRSNIELDSDITSIDSDEIGVELYVYMMNDTQRLEDAVISINGKDIELTDEQIEIIRLYLLDAFIASSDIIEDYDNTDLSGAFTYDDYAHFESLIFHSN